MHAAVEYTTKHKIHTARSRLIINSITRRLRVHINTLTIYIHIAYTIPIIAIAVWLQVNLSRTHPPMFVYRHKRCNFFRNKKWGLAV